MATLLGLPALAASTAAAALYAALGGLWLATEGPRESLLRGSRSVASVAARVALQLLISLVLSVSAYAAIYAAIVPEAGVVHELHFGLCQPPLIPAAATAVATTTTTAARVARISFVEDEANFYVARTEASAASAAGLVTIAPPLARSYDYSVELCLRLPESPPNVEAGTFVASIKIVSEGNATLLSSSRPLVLRYRSPQAKWMRNWFYALPLVLGWMEEAQTLCALLADGFTNLRAEPAHRATVALVSTQGGVCGLQLYDATLTFGVRLGGVTRAMSSYFFASAALGVGSLMVLHWIALLLFELRPAAGGEGEGGGGGGGTGGVDERRAAAARRRREADARAANAAASQAFEVEPPDLSSISGGGTDDGDEPPIFRMGDLHEDVGARRRR